ncbi:MAG: hypothetical protein U0931_21050 [Vulcanimicrobiota bacterium]
MAQPFLVLPPGELCWGQDSFALARHGQFEVFDFRGHQLWSESYQGRTHFYPATPYVAALNQGLWVVARQWDYNPGDAMFACSYYNQISLRDKRGERVWSPELPQEDSDWLFAQGQRLIVIEGEWEAPYQRIRRVHCWDTESRQKLWLRTTEHQPLRMLWLENGGRLVVAWEKSLEVWDGGNGHRLQAAPLPGYPIQLSLEQDRILVKSTKKSHSFAPEDLTDRRDLTSDQERLKRERSPDGSIEAIFDEHWRFYERFV